MEENFSNSCSAVLERDKGITNCEYCGEVTEAQKTSCPECLEKNNPEAEILPEEFLTDYIETLAIKYFSPDHEDDEGKKMSSFSSNFEDEDEEEEERDNLVTSETARFREKPPRARSSSSSSDRSSSKNISVKKSMAKIKHEKQAKFIIYAIYALITIAFFGVLILRWDAIKAMLGF